ncbi:MAG: erythromycin biosynthesis sensory transduction protein eryC1 [Luteitalea sp.]|nr:erythromycin biosynthesis sensory transduction protein eryC1 [Luteitalea sp.]
MTPPIPFLDLITPHRELEEELVAAFRDAVRSAAFIGGPEVEAFEREFAAYCGTKYCVGVASGTDAVRFALMAAGVGLGDAVVTVSHTFIATVEAISQAGADTELVDIDERTYCMSPDRLLEYLEACQKDQHTGRPLGQRSGRPIRAVVPVHLYGQVAEMDSILDIASHYDLFVVEDACQAQGAEYYSAEGGWRRAGSFGKAGAFSFYPGKNLGACGEAGAVTTDDEQVAQKIRMLREHGQAQKYYHDLEGYNGRLDAIQAAFLRIKLRHLDRWNEQRKSAAARYAELLSGAPDITPPFEPETSRAVYHLYVVRTKDRDALAAHLKAESISAGLHYPLPVHLQKCYRDWGYDVGDLPVTERAASEVLSLPMFPGLTKAHQERVASGIETFASVIPG